MARNKAFDTVCIMGIAASFGLLFWVVDSYFEYVFFHENLSFLLLEGPENFLESLVLKVPLHSLFVRTSFLVAALFGGVLVAVFFHIKSQSDAALRVSEEKYRTIFETARDAILLCTPQSGRIVDVNRFACELYGHSREELLVMNCRHLAADPEKPILPADHAMPWLPLQYHRKKNQDIFPTEVSVSTNYWNGQEISTVVIRDISERIQGENEKKLLETQLHRAQKMEALGALAGGVAHDLNNILSALVGYPDLLLLDLPDDSPLRKPLETIRKSGQKAGNIVHDLLTLARRGVATTETVNLNTVIAEYFQSLEFNKLQESYPLVVLEVHLDKELLNMSGSPVHLSKAIMNLVANAMEAIPGDGKIMVTTANIFLDKTFSGYEQIDEGEYVRFRIVDTGTGISEIDVSRIFEPFYSKKVMGKSGTGLGMAVIWGTVKDHRGYIDLHSVPLQGTRFDLYFPVSREKRPAEKGSPVASAYHGTETILVVDDVEEQRDIISHMLTRFGYRVTPAASGEAALEYLKSQSVDLLILDMIMDPGIDGLTTFQLVKQRNSGQKAIISSGFSESDRVREAMRLGVGAYLRKPYVMKELVETVRRELDRDLLKEVA